MKIYDVSTFKTVHTLDFPNGVLSLGVSKNDDTLVAGLVDGLVSISRREDDVEKKPIKKKLTPYHYVSNTHLTTVDTLVKEAVHEKETKYDHHLRKFRFSKALESVLTPYVSNKNPQITVTLLQELIRRRALGKAFKGRDSKSLIQIIRFFIRNITDPRFTRVLVDAAGIFLDNYAEHINSLPANVRKLIVELSNVLKQETELLNELAELQGMMQMLLATQITIDDQNTLDKNDLLPSAGAQKNFVLTIS